MFSFNSKHWSGYFALICQKHVPFAITTIIKSLKNHYEIWPLLRVSAEQLEIFKLHVICMSKGFFALKCNSIFSMQQQGNIYFWPCCMNFNVNHHYVFIASTEFECLYVVYLCQWSGTKDGNHSCSQINLEIK